MNSAYSHHSFDRYYLCEKMKLALLLPAAEAGLNGVDASGSRQVVLKYLADYNKGAVDL